MNEWQFPVNLVQINILNKRLSLKLLRIELGSMKDFSGMFFLVDFC